MDKKISIELVRKNLPRMMVNVRKGYNGQKMGHVISYDLDYCDGKSYKRNTKTIGHIHSDTGFGPIVFKAEFLRDNPLFEHVKVTRVGKNTSKNNKAKEQFSIEILENTKDKTHLRVKDKDSIFAYPCKMQFGSSYFLELVIKESATGRALKALELHDSLYDKTLSLLIYAIVNGLEHPLGIRSYQLSHVLPYQKAINEASLEELFLFFDKKLQDKFFLLKQDIISKDKSAKLSFFKSKYIAEIVSNDKGLSSVLLTDANTKELVGFNTYIGKHTDKATLQDIVAQSPSQGSDICFVLDSDILSICDILDLKNTGISVLMHVAKTDPMIKTLVSDRLSHLAMGNHCKIIKCENEVNHVMVVERLLPDATVNEGNAGCSTPIFYYLIYNTALSHNTSIKLCETLYELNLKYGEHKEAIEKARVQHKRKPQDYEPDSSYSTLLDEGVIYLDSKTDTYLLNEDLFFKKSRESSVAVLASATRLDESLALNAYSSREMTKRLWYTLQSNPDGDKKEASNKTSFDGKFFIALLATEIRNIINTMVQKWNATADKSNLVVLTDGLLSETLKELDQIEGTQYVDRLIPLGSLTDNQLNLFNALDVKPIELV